MKLYNKEYKNAYLMFGIMTAMFLYMGVSLVIVDRQVESSRSCVTTCHVDIQSNQP